MADDDLAFSDETGTCLLEGLELCFEVLICRMFFLDETLDLLKLFDLSVLLGVTEFILKLLRNGGLLGQLPEQAIVSHLELPNAVRAALKNVYLDVDFVALLKLLDFAHQLQL